MNTIDTTAVITLTCRHCRTRATAQAAHLENLLAAGPWMCDACKRCES